MGQTGGVEQESAKTQGIPEAFRNADGSIRFERPLEKFFGKTLPAIAQFGILGTVMLVTVNALTGGATMLAWLAGAAVAGYVSKIAQVGLNNGVLSSRKKHEAEGLSDHENPGTAEPAESHNKGILENVREFSQKLGMSHIPLVDWDGGRYAAHSLRGKTAQLYVDAEKAPHLSAEDNAAVVAHEMVHIDQRDSRSRLHRDAMNWALVGVAGMGALILQGMGLMAMLSLGPAVAGSFGVTALTMAGVCAGGMIASAAVASAQSRYIEMVADRGAVMLTGSQSITSALENIERLSLPPKNKLMHAFAMAVVGEHPSIRRRAAFVKDFHEEHYADNTEARSGNSGFKKSPAP